MADSLVHTQPIQSIQKFIKDRNETLSDDKSISYHRNGMFQTIKNTELFATNEPANLLCIKLPYKYLGSAQLSELNKYLVFSGDETNSEIGIADTLNCKYTKLANSPCLSFSKNNNPITGFVRVNADGQEEVIFVDGKNPDRIINLSKVPYKYTIDKTKPCEDKIYTKELDCEQLKLNQDIDIPCLTITKGTQGNLEDGVYYIYIAYSINGQKFSDYYSASVPIQINNNIGGTNSISIDINNLDRDFDTYQIAMTSIVKGITTHSIIGTYPTSQKHVVITDTHNPEYKEGISSTELVLNKVLYDRTNLLSANSEVLFRADINKKPFLNYQPQAFNIKVQYYVKQVPLHYYRDNGADIGYFRNENYNFLIRWIYKDGEKSNHFQIGNRKPTSKDLTPATGDDVIENVKNTHNDCNFIQNPPFWMVYNTADKLIPIENSFNCNERIIGYGATGYHESTEKYPDDYNIFGDSACTPIRYHRMPDEEKVPRFTIIDGVTYINILGVKFLNVERPKDKDGNYIDDIQGYEILRSLRDEANSTVIARGITTNMGGYTDSLKRNILYKNFPFNDVRKNTYLSSKQTYKIRDKEQNYVGLTKFYEDKLSFYSPFGNYFGRKSLLGTYIQFETEETGISKGFFEVPYKHPRHKLVTNFALLISAIVGAIEALVLQLGDVATTYNRGPLDKGGTTNGVSGPIITNGTSTGALTVAMGQSAYPTTQTTVTDTPHSFPILGDLLKLPQNRKPLGALIYALKLLQSLGLLVLDIAKFAQQILDTIKNFSPYVQYARQYNAECFYNEQKTVKLGNKRRAFLSQPFYLENGLSYTNGFTINNGGRNSSIYLELQKKVPFPSTKDVSRVTMGDLGLKHDDDTFHETLSSVYYTTIMKPNPNQYGTINGVIPVKIHTCMYPLNKGINKVDSPIMFGGDCIIAEQTHLNKFPLFRQDLTNTDFPDGVAFDYRLYNNVAYSRYWIDTTDYDIGSLISKIFSSKESKPNISDLPNQKFNMDLPNVVKNEWIEHDQVFYTSCNGVIRYIGEVPYNIEFREAKEEEPKTGIYEPHYWDKQVDLSYIFRSDFKEKPEGFILNPSYKYLNQVYVSSIQTDKYPVDITRLTNTVLYSLPASQNQKFNNWQYFLPLNQFTFDKRDFGQLTGIHAMDQDRILYLFSKASPFVSPGRSVLKLQDQTVTIGDGGIFAQVPREILHTDIAYGSNHDSYAFSSNPFGHFYVSEYQGKLFNFSDKLDEFSREGWHKWCAEFIPIRLRQKFPEFKLKNNPVSGVGYQIVYDNIYESVYYCKKDYYPKPEKNITYDPVKNQFKSGNTIVELTNTDYFEDCSMTLSYSPSMKSFQSFHDWIPDAVIQEERHFLTVKDNGIWKHNTRKDLFCNYYNKDYPYQLGFQQSLGQNTSILQSIEYIQEAYTYKTDALDRYHEYYNTFDWAMVWNSEQCSGLLNLIEAENIRYQEEVFPEFISDLKVKIPYRKVENKFRFNMFYDYTKNRGRYDDSKLQPIFTKLNGYDFIINPSYIDFKIERPPRLRHNWFNVWYSKEICGPVHYITKINNSKFLFSPR